MSGFWPLLLLSLTIWNVSHLAWFSETVLDRNLVQRPTLSLISGGQTFTCLCPITLGCVCRQSKQLMSIRAMFETLLWCSKNAEKACFSGMKSIQFKVIKSMHSNTSHQYPRGLTRLVGWHVQRNKWSAINSSANGGLGARENAPVSRKIKV